MIYTLYIVNKAGSLLFYGDYNDAPKLAANERITLASTFHGISTIAKQLSPIANSGIEELEADTFRLQCFVSPTGVQFFAIADPSQTGLDGFLRKAYEIYSDYVLKNPFYSLDMPIRCDLFSVAITQLATSMT
eukprot:m.35023 g.35023  ORF g.35023 m.35023 type:complete len:133 (-) comp11232_c0_seq2:385-783(-)